MSLPGSLAATGSVVAPAAGAAIVSIPNVPAGFYRVQVVGFLSATAPAAGDTNNIRLSVPAQGGGQQNGPTLPLVPALNTVTPFEIWRLSIGASGTVSVNAVGAGTAAVAYNVAITLDPVYP